MGGTARDKGSDEVFCRSCGERIKKMAEICPDCGVANAAAPEIDTSSHGTMNNVRAYEHDPSQHDTTVSETWWYGVAGGVALWILGFLLTGPLDGSAVVGFVVFVAWVLMPVAAYFDMQYIRANAKWNPNTVIWMVLLAVWLVNIVAGGVYLYRRHEVLGTP